MTDVNCDTVDLLIIIITYVCITSLSEKSQHCVSVCVESMQCMLAKWRASTAVRTVVLYALTYLVR